MAKRAPVGETPYRPLLDPGVISAALGADAPLSKASSRDPQPSKVVEMSRTELSGQTFRNSRELIAPAPVSPERHAPILLHEVVAKLDQEKRMLVTRAESIALDRLVASLAGSLKTQVKLSHVLRALVTLVLHAEGEVDRRAREAMPLSRPANGDFNALQDFEREIAKLIASALRDSGPLRE